MAEIFTYRKRTITTNDVNFLPERNPSLADGNQSAQNPEKLAPFIHLPADGRCGTNE